MFQPPKRGKLCQSRKGNLQEFFSNESLDYQSPLSQYGTIRKPRAKSDFMKYLDEVINKEGERTEK